MIKSFLFIFILTLTVSSIVRSLALSFVLWPALGGFSLSPPVEKLLSIGILAAMFSPIGIFLIGARVFYKKIINLPISERKKRASTAFFVLLSLLSLVAQVHVAGSFFFWRLFSSIPILIQNPSDFFSHLRKIAMVFGEIPMMLKSQLIAQSLQEVWWLVLLYGFVIFMILKPIFSRRSIELSQERVLPKDQEQGVLMPKEETKQKILNLLINQEYISLEDVIKMFRASRSTAETYLEELREEEKISIHWEEGKGVFYVLKR